MTPGAVGMEVGLPLEFRIPSAMMERAEFPVHRNKTFDGISNNPGSRQPQQVGAQPAGGSSFGFTARTNALMNFPSPWGARASRSIPSPARKFPTPSVRH